MYTYVVIDDEPLIRRGILKKLENYPGIQCVAQASNGKAALELIEEKDPDFVITDMKMPIMDGTQLLPVLSTQYPEKYIIVISGYKDFDYAKEALRAKTLDYIVKPFSREALCSAVDKAVELLQKVIRRILDSWYEVPREIRLFFYYPSDEYLTYLMTVDELMFADEIDCRELFDGNDARERIVEFVLE